MRFKVFLSFCLALAVILIFVSCKNEPKAPPGSVITSTPEELQAETEDIIRKELAFSRKNNGRLDDSILLSQPEIVEGIYDKYEYSSIWTDKGKWLPVGDSLLEFIGNSKLYGLFPSDYHYPTLLTFRERLSKLNKMDAVLWSKIDLMLTDGLVQMIKDVKLGRLPNDSVTGRKDSVIEQDRYISFVDTIQHSISISSLFQWLEPTHSGYQALKNNLKAFIDSSDTREFTIVPIPGKNVTDFKPLLQRRLFEGGYLPTDSVPADSLQLVTAIKKFQKDNGLTVDGVAGGGTVRTLNLSDKEKFVRIALTMDKYKLLPEKMPFRYIWVNIPSFLMELREADTVKLSSKIIVGKAQTRTPLLTSAISELITYPQWTMPNSIIVKEVLPAAKKDPGYFERKGYSLIDSKGEVIDPYAVEWSKYSKGLPYKVVQGSGDDNALGILKFNFNNKYAVYLHDTNQRYLFARDFRSLSHGCVRVQEWEKLAYTIIRYDNATNPHTSPMEDSLGSWLKQKVKRSIPIRNRVPVYIRYYGCEGKSGSIVFYDDIYGEDRELRQKYFAGK